MNAKTLTLAGAVILVIGLFLPIFTVMGISINLFSPPDGVTIDGIVILACAVLAGALALVNQAKWAVVPALISLGLVGYNYFRMTSEMSGRMGELSAEQQAMVAQLASVNYLGWAVMGLGAVLVLVGGAMGWKSNSPAA